MRLPATRPVPRCMAAVEMALVLSLMVTIILTSLVMGLGVFRMQQMAYLAREGARYASVHGAQYASDTKQSAATASTIFSNAIQPYAIGLEPSQLSYSVTWNQNNGRTYTYKDSNNVTHTVINTVSVTVSYNWIPEALYKGGTIKSTSVVPMCY